MKALTIPFYKLNAARQFMGVNDVRHYLNGIHINTTDGTLDATDGHICARIDIAEEIEALGEDKTAYKDIIFALPSAIKGKVNKIPGGKGSTAIISLEEKTISIIFEEEKIMHSLTIIDGQFPDIARVCPLREQAEQAFTLNSDQPIAINATFFVRYEKAFGKNYGVVFLSMQKHDCPVIVAPNLDGLDNVWGRTIACMMPMRIDPPKKKAE